MDEAVWVREAARERIADVQPARLRATIETRIEDASMVPGVLTVMGARAIDPTVGFHAVEQRAAGVQLIYEGLRLTRTLAQEEPWIDAGDREAANLHIVAADVFVARGFSLLSDTGATEQAVRTVREFGSAQTRRRHPGADREALDRSLEANVFALAGTVGSTVIAEGAPTELLDAYREFARTIEGLPIPDAATAFSDSAGAALVRRVQPAEDGARPSVTDL